MPFSNNMELKTTFTKANCTNNIHAGQKIF